LVKASLSTASDTRWSIHGAESSSRRKCDLLLSINTVFPKIGNRLWYDDQRDVHRHIFDGDQMVGYAFMGDNPDSADNRWLREAFENQVPIIYFLGIAPGRY
jgi:putative restriction endonuclease